MKFAIHLDQQLSKATQDRRSGILRFAATHPDVRIAYLSSDNERVVADGLLLIESKLRHRLRRRPSYPVVTIDEPAPATSPVRWSPDVSYFLNDEAVVRAAVQSYLKRGFTSFAFIGTNEPQERERSRLREEIFVNLLGIRQADVAVYNPPAKAFTGYYDETNEIKRFLAERTKPCAILLYADSRAPAVFAAAREANLQIPEQLNIFGIDNETDFCENTTPTLSSVQPDFAGITFKAMEALYELVRSGTHPPPIEYSYGVKAVIERESTQDLSGAARIVSRAEAYLRQNALKPVHIDDIAISLKVSRRLLERHYRAISGKTLHETITDLRLTEAKRLLAETRMPVAEIAASCGYSSDIAFRLAFRRAFNLRPGDYRNLRYHDVMA